MKITYDKEADALYIKLSDKKVADSEEVETNVVVDYDEDDNVIGIEILYFVQKHREDVFPAFKEMEAAVWQHEFSKAE